MSITLNTITDFLEEFAPLELAEEWDNVGLLLGTKTQPVSSVITCLTLTPDVAREAIDQQANLIVTHHPILFRPVQTITDQSPEGKMLLDLIRNEISVYSPHTAFDSAQDGINYQIADALNLTFIEPMRPSLSDPLLGAGRYGVLEVAQSLEQVLSTIKAVFGIPFLQYVGDLNQNITKIAIACGSAGEFLNDAKALACELFITGETRFHTCLEAREIKTAMILLGHHHSERPAIENLAVRLKEKFTDLTVWASDIETDPVQWSVS